VWDLVGADGAVYWDRRGRTAGDARRTVLGLPKYTKIY
jgi:hypothetical protein